MSAVRGSRIWGERALVPPNPNAQLWQGAGGPLLWLSEISVAGTTNQKVSFIASAVRSVSEDAGVLWAGESPVAGSVKNVGGASVFDCLPAFIWGVDMPSDRLRVCREISGRLRPL